MSLPLLLVAHGSRSAAGDAEIRQIVAAVAARGIEARIGYVAVRGPTVAEAVAGLDGAVVVPAFLTSGYHVRLDLPAQLAAAGADPARFPVTAALGPDPMLARAAASRLLAAGLRRGDAVVLAAAGSADPEALRQVAAAARMLSAAVGRPVPVGFAAAALPRIEELVAGLRAAGRRRIAVASWLLAVGEFHDRIAACGADVIAAPLAAHPDVVTAVVRRYRSAARRAGATGRELGPLVTARR
ncbi:sirohydrochlorin chelatase [Pseudonocardia hispaniensis]|uniref:Sirohydrochlorin chelatase n=1 Tax=Pseudonocardia hispaniensis TaxID=904933 RepID=A0ABW1J5A6_9PSEU